jgi:sulfide dehydrogenase [flavocytochrome c] flavoprotein chain
VALRKQLEAMPDGGVYALSIPLAPYRCPPGPYERACMVANYFKKAKPKSKVVIFDANDEIQSKKGLFMKAWADHYAGIIEYRPKHRVTDVDAATNTLKFEFNDDFKAACERRAPMRAGDIAVKTGLATNNRWCEVDFLTFESKAAKNIHVLGDAIQIAPGMPKSGHMANQHGKTCAAAVVISCCRARSRRTADLCQHLLQLRHRRGRGPRGQRAPLRRRKEDHAHRAGLGRCVQCRQRARRPLRSGLGRNIWADTLA